MINFRSTRRAGFECGTTGAKLVVLARRGGALQVEHVLIEEVLYEARAKGSARASIDLARHLLMHKYFSGCRTVLAPPGATDSCFVILPKMGRNEVEGALLLQAGKLVSWENERPVMSFTAVEFLRNRMGHLVGLADWKSVKSWGRVFEASGGVVEDVTVSACAYQSLARSQGWHDEFPAVLVADIGAATSWFYVLDSKSVRFMRKIPVGGDAMTNTLTTAISTDSGTIELNGIEAEEVKITGCLPDREHKERKSAFRSDEPLMTLDRPETPVAGPDENCRAPKKLDQLDVLMRPVIERIASEITRSIQFFRDNAGQSIDAVFLTGGATQSALLRTHLEKSVGLQVRVVDPFAGLEFGSARTKSYAEKNSSRLAVAVGLALTEQPAISLLPKHVQVIKRFASFMPKAVAALLALCFLPLIWLGIDRTVRIKSVRGELDLLQSQVQAADQSALRLNELQAKSIELTASKQKLEDMIGRNPLWPGVLNAIADAVPNDIILLRCGMGAEPGKQSFVLLGGKVLRSAARFDDAMSSLLSDLGSSVFFRRVSIISAEAVPSESALGTFEIQCELVF